MSTLVITLIQTNLFWESKQANLTMLEQKINGIKEKTELIVLPEMFSTGFSMNPEILAESMEGETVQWMKRISKEKKAIIAGSVIIKEGEAYFNRLIWMLPNGEYGVYDKRHCFAFAGENEHYTPGNKRLIASVKGWRLNLQVCYDLRFPVWARQQQEQGPEYDILLYVANWPERRSHAWKTLLQARAIENQCYAVGVNRVGEDGNGIAHSGDSMIVDPLGEIVYTLKDREEIISITLEKDKLETIRSKFQFLSDADRFKILD